VQVNRPKETIGLSTKTTEPEQETPQSPAKPNYPGTWIWDEHGDVIEGAYVELSEAHTRFDGETRPILVLEVAGEKRTVWLFHTALQNQLREELLRRPGNELRVGEPVRIERLGKQESENGFTYMNYRASFPESPKRSPLDILGGGKAEPESESDDGIPF
jgi:hypothetical protein